MMVLSQEPEKKNEDDERYILRLYVNGQTPKSAKALTNMQKICEEQLKGRYKLEVIDIVEKPQSLRSDQVVAIPTLIKKLPPPIVKIIGDMSDVERVLVGLNIMSD
jgi:circadian clock protein KaiB